MICYAMVWLCYPFLRIYATIYPGYFVWFHLHWGDRLDCLRTSPVTPKDMGIVYSAKLHLTHYNAWTLCIIVGLPCTWQDMTSSSGQLTDTKTSPSISDDLRQKKVRVVSSDEDSP